MVVMDHGSGDHQGDDHQSVPEQLYDQGRRKCEVGRLIERENDGAVQGLEYQVGPWWCFLQQKGGECTAHQANGHKDAVDWMVEGDDVQAGRQAQQMVEGNDAQAGRQAQEQDRQGVGDGQPGQERMAVGDRGHEEASRISMYDDGDCR